MMRWDSDQNRVVTISRGGKDYDIPSTKIIAEVTEFLKSLHKLYNKPVGLFVTFGGVTVGSNLTGMSRIIRKKGGRIAGALQLEAEHAMMFKGGNPLAKGKPDTNDISSIKTFIDRCGERASSGTNALHNIPGIMKYFSFLAYPPAAKYFLPRLKLNMDKCTACGKCAKNCPTNNISITDKAAFHGDNCLLCYNCVRVCNTGATDAGLFAAENVLRLASHVPEKKSAVY